MGLPRVNRQEVGRNCLFPVFFSITFSLRSYHFCCCQVHVEPSRVPNETLLFAHERKSVVAFTPIGAPVRGSTKRSIVHKFEKKQHGFLTARLPYLGRPAVLPSNCRIRKRATCLSFDPPLPGAESCKDNIPRSCLGQCYSPAFNTSGSGR